jgi:L-asparagine transporter-like permease
MAALKVVLYFLSGFCVIAGAVCVGIFFHNGSVQALGSGALLLCFGIAGILVSIFFEQILRLFRDERARG